MFREMWSKRVVCTSTSGATEEQAGLRNILTKISIPKSNLVLLKPICLLNSKYDSFDCYLKYCHLCIKPLNLDKEIYMYKGDLGFCSVECRERQIYMDEIREMEANSNRIFSNFRLQQRGGRCETTKLLEEFRRRRHPFSSPSTTRERVVFSYS